MASAIFVAPVESDNVALDFELILDDGTDGYGYSIIGQMPSEATCLVRVWSSQAVLDTMAADDNYLFVEDTE